MTHQTTDGGPLGPYAISLIRTAVPLAWGYVVSWLIGLGLPAAILTTYHDLVVGALTVAVTGVWYALWRWLETAMPALDSLAARVAVIIALGHPAAPSYATPSAVAPVAPPTPPPSA
jgi:hypothetical protein